MEDDALLALLGARQAPTEKINTAAPSSALMNQLRAKFGGTLRTNETGGVDTHLNDLARRFAASGISDLGQVQYKDGKLFNAATGANVGRNDTSHGKQVRFGVNSQGHGLSNYWVMPTANGDWTIQNQWKSTSDMDKVRNALKIAGLAAGGFGLAGMGPLAGLGQSLGTAAGAGAAGTGALEGAGTLMGAYDVGAGAAGLGGLTEGAGTLMGAYDTAGGIANATNPALIESAVRTPGYGVSSATPSAAGGSGISTLAGETGSKLMNWMAANPQQAIQLAGLIGGKIFGGNKTPSGSTLPSQAGLTATPPAAFQRSYVAPPAGYRPGFSPEHNYFKRG